MMFGRNPLSTTPLVSQWRPGGGVVLPNQFLVRDDSAPQFMAITPIVPPRGDT